MGTTDLHDEMLAAFLAIEPHDAHVKTRRIVKAGEQAEVVAASVAHHRRINHTTGTIASPEPSEKAAKSDKPLVAETWVDAPLKTWAQTLHELDMGIRHAGRERAMVDRRTLMGGFCRFHGTEAQEKAAARFKAIYERSQVGGAKAVDPSREAVDGGGINPESVIEIGADARTAYNEMVDVFGKSIMKRFEYVMVGEHGPTAYTRWLCHGQPQSGQMVARCSADFRKLMDHLAVHLKMQNKVA